MRLYSGQKLVGARLPKTGRYGRLPRKGESLFRGLLHRGVPLPEISFCIYSSSLVIKQLVRLSRLLLMTWDSSFDLTMILATVILIL